MRKVLILIAWLYIQTSMAQIQNALPCSTPQASEFDFWLGQWNLTWSDTLHGTNNIEKLYGNCVVHENFNDSNTSFSGQSWSVYNPNSKQWQQTWVDSQGAYFALTGNMRNDSMILLTAEKMVPQKVSPSGKIQYRMLYYNIRKNSFDWEWQRSNNSGANWQSNWKIHYDRKK